MTDLERAARAIREEITRQYRDDERGKCPAGAHYYEQDIAPEYIARAVLEALRPPSEAAVEAMARALCVAIGFPPDANVMDGKVIKIGWHTQLPKARAAHAALFDHYVEKK